MILDVDIYFRQLSDNFQTTRTTHTCIYMYVRIDFCKGEEEEEEERLVAFTFLASC